MARELLTPCSEQETDDPASRVTMRERDVSETDGTGRVLSGVIGVIRCCWVERDGGRIEEWARSNNHRR